MIKNNIDQQIHSDQYYMGMALELAAKGIRSASPNPMVGAVIVHPQRGVIGSGWHKRCGGPHAEVEAVASVASHDEHLLVDSTMYVTLEPCSHYGRTPPCCDLIISKKFARVVVATEDCDPRVAGRGLKKIKDAGIEVEQGVMEAESRELNKRFFTRHTVSRPYIILKWAQTTDGYLDAHRDAAVPPCWMTSAECKKNVHLWRSQEDAIMVGDRTVMMDNPELTVRMVDGENPIRVVLDPQCRLSGDYKIFNDASATLLFVPIDKVDKAELMFADNPSTRVMGLDFSSTTTTVLDQFLRAMVDQGVLSIFVEGGASLLNAFIEQNLWDEARVFVSSKSLPELYPDHGYDQGVLAPDMTIVKQNSKLIVNDTCLGLKIFRRSVY